MRDLRLLIGVFLLFTFTACNRAGTLPPRDRPSLSPTAVVSPTVIEPSTLTILGSATATGATSDEIAGEARGESMTQSPEPTPMNVAPTPLEANGRATALSQANLDDFRNQVDDLLQDVPAHVGVVVARPDGTVLYEQDSHTLFESASLYKLAIMVEVYRERDAGELTFDDLVTLYPGFFYEADSVYGYGPNVYDKIPVGTLLDNMITLSSNVAATALLNLVGTDQVNQTAASLGMTNTQILWYPTTGSGRPDYRLISARTTPYAALPAFRESVDGAYNVTTPSDIALLFERLVQGTVISPETSGEMIDLLARQQINERLPALLPDGTRVAHKTGDLDYSIHDAGAIYGPNGPVVVTILSDEVENRAAVVEFMQEVARLAFALP